MKPAVLDRESLSTEQQAILDRYVRLMSTVLGQVSVWVTTDEGRLHFHTLVAPGRQNLKEVLRAERILTETVDASRVDFDTYQDASVARLLFSQPPLYRSR